MTDEQPIEEPYREGVVCGGCGKHVTSTSPPERCADCGGFFVPADEGRLACDRCGHPDAAQVLGNERYNRLCDHCIIAVNDAAPVVYLRDGTPVRVKMIGAECEGDVSGEGHFGYVKRTADAEQPTIYFEEVNGDV